MRANENDVDTGATAGDGQRPPGADERAVHRVFGWLGTHVRSLHAALGIYLVAGFSVLLATAAAFAWLADEVGEGGTQRFDNAVLLWMHRHASPTLSSFALEVTSLGSGLPIAVVLLVSTAFLWATRHRYSVLLLWIAVAGGEILNATLKGVFDRPRPRLFPWLTHASFSSFPSGHAMTAVIVYVTLAYLIARLEPSRAMRRLTFAVTGLLVLGIGLSRMYLGVHYPSDVLAGYAAGCAWATFCALGMEAVRHFRVREPRVHRAERDLDQPVPPLGDAL
jgi:undecaprenyl-diphosphatase